MKSDERLKHDVEEELRWDPSLNADTIIVSCKGGVVSLSGHVRTCAEKHTAELALQRVVGVRALAIDLEVQLRPEHERSDSEIAKAAMTALKWSTIVGAQPKPDVDQIQVSVEHGWLTLRGEVEWEYQRRAAADAVRVLTGVKGVTNMITITPQTSPFDVKSRILDAFKRQVAREVEQMNISVHDGTVTLSGKVDSVHERDAAQQTAWSAPGIRAVNNELTIG